MERFILLAGAMIFGVMISLSSWASTDWSMAEDLYGHDKARSVGDLLTIQIVENSKVEKDAERTAKKSYTLGGSASAGNIQIDSSANSWTNFSLPKFSLSGNRDFSGAGGIEDTDKFESLITVRVVDVFPNGDLLVEGKRTLVLKDDTVQMVLTGTVRVKDINNDNIVESTKVADAMIQYKTKGSLNKTAKKGIIPRLVDWVNPF